MLKKTILAFALAIQNIRSNLFHTVLSVLGIVIGVAALVSILSLIDGLEKFAKGQISMTTSLNAVVVTTEEYRTVGEMRLKKDSFSYLDYAHYAQLVDSLGGTTRASAFSSLPAAITVDTSARQFGVMVQAVAATNPEAPEMLAGRCLTETDYRTAQPVALINQWLAQQLLGHTRYAESLQRTIHLQDRTLTVVGVMKGKEDKMGRPQLYLPLSLLTAEELQHHPPSCFVEATEVEQVMALKGQIQRRLARLYPGRDSDFSVMTNDYRVKQTAQAFVLFRIIMGLIVGISIVVGGIGVMNVLLISVTERTAEIGIRKAVGANRRDILRLFLAESITVSAFGSFLGLVLGVLATMIIIPIVKLLTELPFQAAYTWNTFFVISTIAVLVGIIFGTYPAMKAAKMDPVEAIRRE